MSEHKKPGAGGRRAARARRIGWLAGTATAVAALAACAPRIDTHGFMPNPELVAQLEPGRQSKAEVGQTLGTPSAVSTFDGDTWYYITQRTRNFAFFKPEIIDQTVLVVAFDEAGVVSGIQEYALEDSLIVEPVDRATPTAGNELTLLQQLFGNIGRFSKY